MKVSNKMTCRCKEKERELEELVHQLHVERANKERAEEDPASCHVENQPLMDETDLQVLLRDERRKSANFELQVVWWNVSLFWMKQRYNNKVKRRGLSCQANLFQRFMLNRHHEDQKMIANLKRQVKKGSCSLHFIEQLVEFMVSFFYHF